MEAVAILIISIAGLTLLIIAVVSVASNLDKNSFVRKDLRFYFLLTNLQN